MINKPATLNTVVAITLPADSLSDLGGKATAAEVTQAVCQDLLSATP